MWAVGQRFTLVGFVFIQQHHNAGHAVGTCGVESPKATSQLSGHHCVQSIPSFWVQSDGWQGPLPSDPHTVCLVSFGSQNMVAHGSLQFDVTRSVIPRLWNSSSDAYWLFSVPLTWDKPFVPLVRFYALSHFGRPVSWCETFNRCFCRSCLFELGLVSFQVCMTPCRTCSAC